MPVTAINAAEAIIDPLWAPGSSELAQWRIEPGVEQGLQVRQNWCWVQFEWAQAPPAGRPALQMSRRFAVDCRGYDRLLVSLVAPVGCTVTLLAQTDLGERRQCVVVTSQTKEEMALDLQGASRLDQLAVTIQAAAVGQGAGWFNWIGLQDQRALPLHERQWQGLNPAWPGDLAAAETPLSFVPTLGLLLDAGDIARLRVIHQAMVDEHGASTLLAQAEQLRQIEPEQFAGEYVNFWGDTRYNRVRDHGKRLLTQGINAALLGMILQDAQLLRLAARFALTLGRCGHWDDGFICRFPGSDFDHRCFVQSLCMQEAALLLDFCGELITPRAKAHLCRRIAEEGLGAIHYNTWKFEYIFTCNQMAWFSPGRMLGCLLLERSWKRVRPYTELAYQDLVESLDKTVLPDGGYVEGPTYFRCVGRDGGMALLAYARARGQMLAQVFPAAMKRCAAFAQAVASTSDEQDNIPICDSHSRHDPLSMAIMATALPESAWAAMLEKASRRWGRPDPSISLHQPELLTLVLAWSLHDRLQQQRAAAGGGAVSASADRTCVIAELPEMGLLSCVRQVGGYQAKLLILGNKAGAGHTHEDKGSFVLEYAGEVFALDAGTCDYSSPFAHLYKQCQRHNMLVPVSLAQRAAPACPLPADVKPWYKADAGRWCATIDATPGWEKHFVRWTRTWDWPAPDHLIIRDDYQLQQAGQVAFYWQTHLPVRIAGSEIIIQGKQGRLRLTAPADCLLSVEELPTREGPPQQRLALTRTGAGGALEVHVHLQ